MGQVTGGWLLQLFVPLNESIRTGIESAFSFYNCLDGVPRQSAGFLAQVIVAWLGDFVDVVADGNSQQLHSVLMHSSEIS